MIKKLTNILTILFLVIGAATNAQDYEKVDAVVKSYPKAFTSIDRIAQRISNDFAREDEKARAIFTWIALNIKYDVAKWQKIKDVKTYTALSDYKYALKTLVERKGVCQGYSVLYKTIAEKTGLEAVVIVGFAKTETNEIGMLPVGSNHAWNAVKIDGAWQLIDVTWASGHIDFGDNPKFTAEYNDAYFFMPPQKFFYQHYPVEKKWLFIKKDENDFAALPLVYSHKYEILSPSEAILRLPQDAVEFNIKGIKPEDTVSYDFTGDEYATEIEDRPGNAEKFSISLKDKKRCILTIYVNNSALAAYSVR